MSGDIAITVIATGFPSDLEKYKEQSKVTVGEAMRAAAALNEEVPKPRGPVKIRPREEDEYEEERPPARASRQPERETAPPARRESRDRDYEPPARGRDDRDDDVPDFMSRLRRKR